MTVIDGLHRPLAAAAWLLMAVLTSGCSSAPKVVVSPPVRCGQPGSTCMSDLLQALEDWQEAYNRRDPRLLQPLYAPGALVTDDEYATVPLSGAALPEFFDEMAQRPTARMRWVVGNLTLFGETAVRSGECEFSDAEGGQTVARTVRYSFAYQRLDGRWRIVLQHFTRRP